MSGYVGVPKLVGDILIDRCCAEMLKASDAFHRGEMSREEFDFLRGHWGRSFLACQGAMRPYRHPGRGGAAG